MIAQSCPAGSHATWSLNSQYYDADYLCLGQTAVY